MTDRDKKLLDDIKTREELEKRGYRRKKCPVCRGVGVTEPPWLRWCLACEGKGYKWEAPLMR